MSLKIRVSVLGLVSALAACAEEHAVDPGEVEETGENLLVAPGEGVSSGHALSAAEAERLAVDTTAIIAPAHEHLDAARLLTDIPRLAGAARVGAIQDYISHAHTLPEGERLSAMKRLAGLWKNGPETSSATPVEALPPSQPISAITSCTIGFGQASALGAMTFYQAYGFAESPWYKHHCSTLGWNFKVDESGGLIAGHYHFWSDNPAVNCITTSASWPNGVMGKDNGTSTCTPVNPLAESRDVVTHTSGHWVRIRNVTATSYGWRAMKIKVKCTVAVRVKIDNTDGTWWEYTNLTPGTWTLLPNGHKAKTAWVMAQNQNAGTPPQFDDFMIAGPL